MLKNIPVKINADKSITANYPYKIYQGEINTVRFVVDPSLVISDTPDVVGHIGFKRIDNQKSGFVPLKKEQDGTYTYTIKDYWTLNIVGKVWYTIKFVSVDGDNKLEYQLYAGNSSFVVNPLADYVIGDDIPPDTSTILQEQIDDLQEQINTNESNINSKLNKEFNTYPKLNWEDVDNKDIVALNRINQDGTVSQYYAEAEDLYTTVNGIRADGDGNVQITGENINVNSTSNITIDEEFNLKVNKSEPLVYYSDTSYSITTLNDIMSSTVEGVKSELVYSGTVTSNNSPFNSVPSFTPKHYIIEYTSNSQKGVMLLSEDSDNNSSVSYFSQIVPVSVDYFEIRFYEFNISIDNNTVRGFSELRTLTWSNNSFSELTNSSTSDLDIKVYAINI